MITAEMREEAKSFLRDRWEEAGEKVIAKAEEAKSEEMGLSEFLSHCTACGGNWGGMLLTGIKELWPEVWKAIPEHMGTFAWSCLCETLVLCGVDTSEEG